MAKPYANQVDVAQYMGLDQNQLPEDIVRLVDRASDVIQDATKLANPDPSSAQDTTALKQATCAQVEYWINVTGEEQDQEGSIAQARLGRSGRVFYANQFARGTGGGVLAPRARRYLWQQGLLYRGITAK